MRVVRSIVIVVLLLVSGVVAQEKPVTPKAPELSNEHKQQIVIAFQQARIAALEAEKADQAAKALFAEIQAKVCGDGYVLSQALACEAKPKVL